MSSKSLVQEEHKPLWPWPSLLLEETKEKNSNTIHLRDKTDPRLGAVCRAVCLCCSSLHWLWLRGRQIIKGWTWSSVILWKSCFTTEVLYQVLHLKSFDREYMDCGINGRQRELLELTGDRGLKVPIITLYGLDLRKTVSCWVTRGLSFHTSENAVPRWLQYLGADISRTDAGGEARGQVEPAFG